MSVSISCISFSLGLQAATMIPIMCAIRFFYGTTLRRTGVAEHIPLARKADTLPAVLTRDQVVRFLKAVPDLEMRTIFITIYSAGLGVSEASRLTARDIDSANMVIHVRQGKGRKDRYVMLLEQLLAILRAYWKCAHLQHLVFPGPDPERHYRALGAARLPGRCPHRRSRFPYGYRVHAAAQLCHSSARTRRRHSCDPGSLGHRHITSTTRYARVALNTIRQIQSPLELLNAKRTPPS